MGLRMEKFGAEEMEVQLFLFTVLQIHLFSPWSTRRGLRPRPRRGPAVPPAPHTRPGPCPAIGRHVVPFSACFCPPVVPQRADTREGTEKERGATRAGQWDQADFPI